MLAFALPHLQRMFPEFQRDWVVKAHVYRSEYTQPIVSLNYSRQIVDQQTPIPGLWLSTMAQIYPEDRGTNYAVREGLRVGQRIADSLKTPQSTPRLVRSA
jgi:hypothetical protein